MITGKSLSDAAREALLNTARRLFESNRHSLRIVHDDVEGEVCTDYESTTLGSLFGYIFKSDVVTSEGETTVVFLVDPDNVTQENLANTEWKQAY